MRKNRLVTRATESVSVPVERKIPSLCLMGSGWPIGKQVRDGMNWGESIILTLPHLTDECYSLPPEYNLLSTCIVTWGEVFVMNCIRNTGGRPGVLFPSENKNSDIIITASFWSEFLAVKRLVSTGRSALTAAENQFKSDVLVHCPVLRFVLLGKDK